MYRRYFTASLGLQLGIQRMFGGGSGSMVGPLYKFANPV
jgi:hypothetical protein